LKFVQNFKICSIWNLFRIWKFVPFEKMFKIWKFVPFENLFRISKIVPFEICSELEKLFHLKSVQNLKLFRIFYKLEKMKKQKKKRKPKKKRKHQFLLGRPIRKIAQRGVHVNSFPTQKASNMNRLPTLLRECFSCRCLWAEPRLKRPRLEYWITIRPGNN
jgi:hypothetical protein